MNALPWYRIENIEELDSPALVVYPERVRANIARAVELIGDVNRLRPHVKTHKSPDVTRLLLDTDIQKFKCATLAEAELLARCGAPDVLLAYPLVGAKIGRFLNLISSYPATQFACLVDDRQAAQVLSDAAIAAGQLVSVYLDLNVGMNRTGTLPNESALNRYGELTRLPGLRLRGLHAYDGHVRAVDLGTRTVECEAAFRPVWDLVARIREREYPAPVLVFGGSPTFPIHARRPDVECSPGTFVYWDGGYQDSLPEQPFEPAALVVTRVISRPDSTKLCLDLGHKSVAAESPLAQRVTFLNAPELRLLSQSEEHLVVEADAGHGYRIGDVLYGLPGHICPTCALYERAFTIEKGRVTGEWRTTARDRFLETRLDVHD
jgi:D-serine deaminase-like pyridoxal phosphate-dependent protein